MGAAEQVHALEGEFHKLQQSRSVSRSPPPPSADTRPSYTKPASGDIRPSHTGPASGGIRPSHTGLHPQTPAAPPPHTSRAPHPADRPISHGPISHGTITRETARLSAQERMVQGGGRGPSAAQPQRESERGPGGSGWLLETMRPRTPSHYSVGPSADGARGRMLNVGGHHPVVDRLRGKEQVILSPNTRWAQAM